MEQAVPDLGGYLFEDACSILQGAGYRVAVVTTGSPTPYRSRVLRQRRLDAYTIELTIGFEHYHDPCVGEKEVNDNALQDH
jgi:hypothetical protein